MGLTNEKEIQFNGKTLILKKMPLRRYDQFAVELEAFMKAFKLVKTSWWRRFAKQPRWMRGEAGEFGVQVEQIIYALRHYPAKVARLIEIATQVPAEDILDADFESVCDLVVEFWQFNNLVSIIRDSIKKVMSTQTES